MKARSMFLMAALGVSVIAADSALVLYSPKHVINATDVQAGAETSSIGFILFTTDRDNPSILRVCPACEEIYAMRPDGSNPTRLTSNNFNDGGAVWSPEAKSIAFHTDRSGGYPQVFHMKADGSDQQLIADPGRNDSGEQLGAGFPSWSPNGDRICFSSRLPPREIFVVEVAGGGITNLTQNSADDFRCHWSPLGDKIAFWSTRDGDKEIYIMNTDGSDPVRLTFAAGADMQPAWSPDGAWIAFETNRDGNAEIYKMNADGTDPVRLTNFPGEDTMPAWSPNGNKIAFHRRISGHAQVFTMNADGTGVTQLTFPTTIEFSGFPSWGNGNLTLK